MSVMTMRSMPPRFIAHLDMDAFYASVELLRYPRLRGRPVVIGGRRRTADDAASNTVIPTLRDYSGRGVITTATYEARALGVHSGMGLMKAAQLAPDALLLPADFDEYRRYSRMFKDAVRAVAPQIEDRGIDEIYVELTGLVMSGPRWRGARRVGTRARVGGIDPAHGARCDRAFVLDRYYAKQAAVENRLGSRETRRAYRAARSRCPRAHLAAADTQAQWHRPQVECAAGGARHPNHRPTCAGRPGAADRALRQ